VRHAIHKKLKSRCGESIAEVLVSILVIAFGLLLLASMILSSQKMIEASKTNEQMINTARSVLDSAMASSGSSASQGTVTVKDLNGIGVNLSGSGSTVSVSILTGSAASTGQSSVEFRSYRSTTP
jgi:Tfp pilus assembly protein PilV